VELAFSLTIYTLKGKAMVKAEWNGAVIAQSDATIMVEGNHYFPRESVNPEFLTESSTKTTCPWKGVASYYSLSVDGKLNADAAWYYPDPFAAAAQIKDHIAFWRGVSVS
jgi:uncharacterized protein (DUF427 family)